MQELRHFIGIECIVRQAIALARLYLQTFPDYVAAAPLVYFAASYPVFLLSCFVVRC